MTNKFINLLNKITGISTPFIGISWNPSKLEAEKARKIIVFLEDKRFFYSPFQVIDGKGTFYEEYGLISVLNVRERLAKELEDLEPGSKISISVSKLRDATLDFLNEINGLDIQTSFSFSKTKMPLNQVKFNTAHKKLLQVIEKEVTFLIETYKIKTEKGFCQNNVEKIK